MPMLAVHLAPPLPILAYLAVCLVASVLAFAAYGFDKWRARRGGWRLSERSLHLLAAAGGWPGALLAQRVFRHKTQKVRFRVVFWAIVVLHIAATAVCVYLWRRPQPQSTPQARLPACPHRHNLNLLSFSLIRDFPVGAGAAGVRIVPATAAQGRADRMPTSLRLVNVTKRCKDM